jgi:hypothetical protein
MGEPTRNVKTGGDLEVGNLTVRGGFNNSQFSKTVTRVANTEGSVTTLTGQVDTLEETAIAIDPYLTNAPPTNNVTGLAISSANNPDGTIDVTVSWDYTQGSIGADGFLVYFAGHFSTPGAIDLAIDNHRFVAGSSATGYEIKLNLPANYAGAGALPIHYRFGVVAVGTRKDGTIPHAAGVVEIAGWIDKLFAPEIHDIPISLYAGVGVQRRRLVFDAEKIDWYDSPDTTPASDEILQARIGRLGVGAAVLMDGTFQAPCVTNSLESLTSIISSVSDLVNGAIKTPDDYGRICYRTATGIYERVYDIDGILGAAVTVYSGSDYRSPTYLYTEAGELYIYATGTAGGNMYSMHLVEGAWATPVLEFTWATISPNFGIIEDDDYNIRCLYGSADPANQTYERVKTGSTWADATNPFDALHAFPVYVKAGGNILAIGLSGASALNSNTLIDGSYEGQEAVSNAIAGATYLDYFITLNDEYIITYIASNTIYAQRFAGGTFETPVQYGIVPSVSRSLYCKQNNNAEIDVFYQYSGAIYHAIYQRYAQIGAGIIKSGSNANGYYEYSSNGKLEQWGQVTYSGSLDSGDGVYYKLAIDIPFPVAFTDNGVNFADIYITSNCGISDNSYILHSWVHPVSTTGGHAAIQGNYNYGSGTNKIITWHAVGKGTP